MKYYVVSDIHSYYTATIEALTEKGYFNDSEPHKLIICGDLFDRGDESKEMQYFVLDLLKKDEVILIRGNHEDLFLELYQNANYWFNRDIFYSHHARNGTIKTVAALTGATTDDLLNADKMSALMKQTPFYTTIIPKTINYYIKIDRVLLSYKRTYYVAYKAIIDTPRICEKAFKKPLYLNQGFWGYPNMIQVHQGKTKNQFTIQNVLLETAFNSKEKEKAEDYFNNDTVLDLKRFFDDVFGDG